MLCHHSRGYCTPRYDTACCTHDISNLLPPSLGICYRTFLGNVGEFLLTQYSSKIYIKSRMYENIFKLNRGASFVSHCCMVTEPGALYPTVKRRKNACFLLVPILRTSATIPPCPQCHYGVHRDSFAVS